MNLSMLKVVDILKMNGNIPATYISGMSSKNDKGFDISIDKIFD
jgi:hypothetical protein